MVESNHENGPLPLTLLEPPVSDVADEIPVEDYCVVGWDLDVTGRKLLDEICHIAGYTPDDDFSLYIMPYGDINNFARKRHNIRIVTVNFYRIIKDTTSNRMLKTKSEVSAITDFIEWLEKVCKKNDKKGVLLICHESYKFNPHLLIKSLLRYNLLERFQNIVKGFVDCHSFAKKKCEQTMVSFSIRTLSKVLLDKENVEIYKASDRAHLAYDIVQHLCAGASEIGNGAASPNEEIVRTVLPYTTSVRYELKVLENLQVVLGRQNTLKPIFAQFLGFKTAAYQERRNALQMRKYLVDAYVDYDMLKNAWSQGKEALEELINDKLSGDDIVDKLRAELVKLLIEHFETPAGELPKSRLKTRYGRRNSKKSSPSSSKSSSKDSPKSSEKSETDTNDAANISSDAPDLPSDIVELADDISKLEIPPLQNNPPAVEVI